MGFFGWFKKDKEDASAPKEPPGPEEKKMIAGIMELSETTAKEILVPRVDVVSLPEVLPYEELYEKILEGGHSRFPVYRDSIDDVIGVLYVKDLAHKLMAGEIHPKTEINLTNFLRKPFFIPESKRLDALLREMKKKRIHIAIAVDEYGGVAGIICFEDILEEIVGEIQDEFDNELEDILKIGEKNYLCDARVLVEDINEKLGLELPNEDFDTLGGFVFDLIGKIPVKYERVHFQDADFIVQSMDAHKIKTIKVVLDASKVNQ
jgi:magnesium and cobalt transporter